MSIKNNNPTWLSNVGAVSIGDSLDDYNKVIHQMIQITSEATGGEPTSAEYQELKSGLNNFQQTVRHVDTSVGASDIFNPPWQFGLDDDIIHPVHDISPNKDGTEGLGSIYNEMFFDTQRVLYLQMGVPKFSGLSNFFVDDSGTLGTIMKEGKLPLGAAIGQLIGGAARIAFKIAIWPISVSNFLGEVISNPIPVTKYYDFKPSMPLYFRLVNSIFSAISVSMGIAMNGMTLGTTGGARESALSRLPQDKLPEIMRDGPDIFMILKRKAERTNPQALRGVESDLDLIKSQQEANNEDSSAEVGIFQRFASGFKDGLGGSSNWIGFRIEKSADASESINSDIGESEVGVSLNSVITSQRNLMFKIQGGKPGDILPNWVGDAFGFMKDIATNTIASAGGTNMIQMASGNGFFDIPHEWKNSSFSKNQNFKIQLRARYGDPVSILQGLYLPFALIMAASSPRAIASNMYTSPFLVQAYCKGLFSIPLGLIKNVNISRGGPEFGWNRIGLPLSLDLDIQIQDLTPTMFISMTDNESSIFNVSVRNTAMLDYIATLSGIGLHSRNSAIHSLLRQKASAVLRLKNTLFSPYFWGYLVADNMGVFKNIYQMTPWGNGAPERFPTIGRL